MENKPLVRISSSTMENLRLLQNAYEGYNKRLYTLGEIVEIAIESLMKQDGIRRVDDPEWEMKLLKGKAKMYEVELSCK